MAQVLHRLGFGQRTEVKSLRKIAFFAHYRNVPRAEGKDGGSTVIVVLRNAWFWMIPVSSEVMSVGLVVERALEELHQQMLFQRAVDDALTQAGRTKQPLKMWVLWPRG